jgi:hypothetical protein
LSNTKKNSSKILKIIDETSKNNYFVNNNFEKNAKILIVKNAQNFLKKKNCCDCEKSFKKNFFLNHHFEISKKLRERLNSKRRE